MRECVSVDDNNYHGLALAVHADHQVTAKACMGLFHVGGDAVRLHPAEKRPRNIHGGGHGVGAVGDRDQRVTAGGEEA